MPVIGDLPILGRLFQSQTKTAVKKNLMIFVTATIVIPRATAFIRMTTAVCARHHSNAATRSRTGTETDRR